MALFTLPPLNSSSERGALAQEIDRKDLITDPAISRRCKRLLNQRDDKIHTRQRLRALLLRNNKLLGRVEENRESIQSRLQFTQTKIKNNIQLAELKIQKMEEDIVRKGCPGVAL